MMDILEMIARKICCAAGDHCYSAVTLNFKFIDDDGDSWCYEISNKCVYCGKPFWSLVNIPKPKEEKE